MLFIGIVRIVFGQMLRALILVVLLEEFDRLALIERDESGSIGLTMKIAPYVPRWLETVRISHDGTVSLLATLVQVAAVFLGLYFAAVSPLFTAYAQAPSGVRQQLTEELIRNGYIGLVAFFAAVSTILLAETAFGVTPGPSSILVTTIVGIVGVLSFVPLGIRTFFYYDPVNLGYRIPHKINRWILAATTVPQGRNSEALQRYYYNHAKSQLDIVASIIESSIGRPSSAYGVAGLAQRSLSLLARYSEAKPSIPSWSDWFPKTHRHPSWDKASFSAIELALSTSMSLPPEEIPDLYWFEDHVGQQLEDTLAFLLLKDDSNQTLPILDMLAYLFQSMSERLEVPEAHRLNCRVQTLLQKHVDESGGFTLEESLFALAILERSTNLLIGPLVGLMAALRQWTPERFSAQVEALDWDRGDAIFRSGLPRIVSDALANHRRQLLFERQIEGHIITPVWYSQQVAARAWVRFLYDSIERGLDLVESRLGQRAESLIAAGRHLAAMVVIDRGRDACMKNLILLDQAHEAADQLEEFRFVREEAWPETDWSSTSNRIMDLKRRLTISLAACIPHLEPDRDTHPDRPDYFGMARFVLAEEAFVALEAKDEELFELIYRPLVQASLRAYPSLLEENIEAPLENRFTIAFDPIAATVDLAGYAVIYSELDGNRFGQIAKNAWDEVFAGAYDSSFTLRIVQLAIYERDHNLREGQSGLICTGWQMALERRLRDEQLLSDDMFGGVVERWRDHPSAIIRAISGPFSVLRTKGTTVFDVTYLHSRPEITEIPISREAVGFTESLNRELARERSDKQEDEERFDDDN